MSANPTGPLTVGNARGAFVGDLLCRVLEAVGHDVTREYYFNDSGSQVERLGLSVLALSRGRGACRRMATTARTSPTWRVTCPASVAEQASADRARGGWIAGEWASERVRAGIEASLEKLGVHFDVWKSEGSLHAQGWVERGIEQLKQAGYMYEQDGALWFRSTDFGDDKDRVVIRSNGEPTYFASDIGYVVEKFSRDFDELIYIWGADHHGTVARLKNAAEALGFDREAVRVLLIAWVRFVRDGEEVSMSKRTGEFVTLDELLAGRRRRRRALVLCLSGPEHRHRLRHRAGAQAVEREPGVLRPVRTRADQLDPAQGQPKRACRPRRRSRASWQDDPIALGLAKELLALPDIVRDAALERETQSITDVRHQPRDDLPRLLSRPAGCRSRRSGDVSQAARTGRCDARHPRRGARHAWNKRAGVYVAAGSGVAPPRRALNRLSSEAMTTRTD